MRRNERPFSWDTISEKDWNRYAKRLFTARRIRIVRVRPDSPDYDRVVALRYRGFIESGFVDPAKTGESAMRLERDGDSIILALFRYRKILATMTLNTITPSHPGMAMELEKKIEVPHPYFRDRGVLEITKLVVDPSARGGRSVLDLFAVAMTIARLLGKEHLWQVSRDVASDMSWREGIGFDYSNGFSFRDPSLNGMPSRVGYLYLPTVTRNPKVPSFIKAIYEGALKLDFGRVGT
jgi:hypothetical protein